MGYGLHSLTRETESKMRPRNKGLTQRLRNVLRACTSLDQTTPCNFILSLLSSQLRAHLTSVFPVDWEVDAELHVLPRVNANFHKHLTSRIRDAPTCRCNAQLEGSAKTSLPVVVLPLYFTLHHFSIAIPHHSSIAQHSAITY
jgi:hypothetical protein